MTLDEMQRIKQRLSAHKAEHPLEYHLWDIVLAIWLVGCVGWLPAGILDEGPWAFVACGLCILAPGQYVAWRRRAHQARVLRCDWLA